MPSYYVLQLQTDLGEGYCQNLCVATRFCRLVKVSIFGKAFSLEFQKFQNQNHRGHKKRIYCRESLKLMQHIVSVLNVTPPRTPLGGIVSNLV